MESNTHRNLFALASLSLSLSLFFCHFQHVLFLISEQQTEMIYQQSVFVYFSGFFFYPFTHYICQFTQSRKYILVDIEAPKTLTRKEGSAFINDLGCAMFACFPCACTCPFALSRFRKVRTSARLHHQPYFEVYLSLNVTYDYV